MDEAKRVRQVMTEFEESHADASELLEALEHWVRQAFHEQALAEQWKERALNAERALSQLPPPR